MFAAHWVWMWSSRIHLTAKWQTQPPMISWRCSKNNWASHILCLVTMSHLARGGEKALDAFNGNRQRTWIRRRGGTRFERRKPRDLIHGNPQTGGRRTSPSGRSGSFVRGHLAPAGRGSRSHGHLLEAVSQAINFPGYGFGHCRPALDLPPSPKPKAGISAADGNAASSGRFSADSCSCADRYGRDSPLGSPGSCGPRTCCPISTSNPCSPGKDDASTIGAHILCQRPRSGSSAWPRHICTPNRHPRVPRPGGTPGNLRRLGESSGRTAQSRRLVLHAPPCS